MTASLPLGLIGTEKGGTGKSTIATNLAALRAQDSVEVLLVDADKQMTSSFWAAKRNDDESRSRVVCVQKRGKAIHRDIQDLARRYEDIIIDAGGQDSHELRSAMVVADRLYLPLQPAQADIWTLETMEDLVAQAQALNDHLEVSVVINRGPTHPRVPEIAEAIVCLQEFPSLPFSGVVLHERRAFRKAMTLGLSVAELEPPDPKAVAEIRSLYNTIYYAETESHTQ